jgi:hypothetical protein
MADRKRVDDHIPALSLNDGMGDLIMEALSHDRYQEKIKKMMKDYTATVEFQELVMTYAGKEYDNRILKSGRFWASTIIAAVITSAISAAIALWIAS